MELISMGIMMNINEIIIPTGNIVLTLTNVKTGKVEVDYYHNLFTTAGKESLANSIRGNTSNNKGIITYCALGTGDTAPALGDTTLEAEIERKLISVRSVSNNQALFEIFFTTAEANGNLKEAGLFGDDATGTKDTGTLFARASIDRVKTDGDTLSLAWTVIIG